MTTSGKMMAIRLMAMLSSSMVFVAIGGCEGQGETNTAEIDKEKLVIVDPDADRPTTHFPTELRQDDATLNEFILAVLKTCEEGDYDEFCRFLGATATPPSYDDFKRIWSGIREIEVVSVHAAETDPPQYFVHAVAHLRREDRANRRERDIVLQVYEELGEWRISGAPKEIVRMILIADTQPASAPTDSGPPRRPEPVSAAPPARPDVYNH